MAALLVCWLLVGCTTLPELPPIRFWDQDGEGQEAVPATVSVLGWTGGEAENRLLQERIRTFEQSNPAVAVTGLLTPDYAAALEETIRQDSPPSLFMVWGHQLPDLVAAGVVQPVPPAFDTAQALPPHLRAAVQVAGQSYCLPRDMTALALYYNPALFERVDAALPHDGWSWGDLRAAAETVTDVNNGLYGLVLSADVSRLLPFLWQADTDGIPWSGSDVTTAVEFYVNLIADGMAVEPVDLDSTWNGEAFGRGRAAMTIEGSWLIPYLAGHFPELNYGIVQLPAGPVRRATTAFISCWAVGAGADPDSAFRLAAHLTTPESNAAWAVATGNLPPGLDQATAWLAEQPAYAPFVASLEVALPWTGPPGFAENVEIANSVLAAAFDSEATVDDVRDRLESLAAPASP